LIIQTIVSVVGIAKTIAVPFDCYSEYVSVVGVTKTITVPFGSLLRLL
jgi:hypothetical protein